MQNSYKMASDGFYTVFTNKPAVAKGVVREKYAKALGIFSFSWISSFFYGMKTHTYD
jgi:hypothetical protein